MPSTRSVGRTGSGSGSGAASLRGSLPTWVLQADAFSPGEFLALRNAAFRLGCPVEQVRIVPFSHEPVERVPHVDGPCIVYGSGGMLDLARSCGWAPGGWDGPAFSMRRAIEALGSLALNADAVFTTYSHASAELEGLEWSSAFLKPDAESKEFPGEVYTRAGLKEHVQRLSTIGYFEERDNAVLLAVPKRLRREWRVFVVAGRVVEASLYAVCGSPARERGAPEAVLEAARDAARIYAPAPVFVIDIAEVVEDQVPPLLKIAEYNSFNSSGFYACDIETIVAAVTDHVAAE